MSSEHGDDRADLPAPPTWQHLLGSLVHDNGPIVIMTAHGAVVCLDAATYAQLGGPATVLPTEAGTAVSRQPSSGAGGPPVRLTPRELQVLQTVATTASTPEAAEHLGVALNTVAQHLVAIRRKYRVRSTTEAVIAARADGHPLPASADA